MIFKRLSEKENVAQWDIKKFT